MPSLTIEGEALWQWRDRQLLALHAEHVSGHLNLSVEILSAELDWFLREVTQLDRLALRLGLFRTTPHIPSLRSLADLDALWHRRIHEHVPVQYLLGTVTWRHFTLRVSPAVLIPRPETELMIDLVLEATQCSSGLAQGLWGDFGTGSGAIALGLVDALPGIKCYAVDVSEDALAIATHNAQAIGFIDRIQFLQGSWFEPVADLKGKFSGILSNPPYIPTATVQTLQPEVVKHEPHRALDGGTDGLNDIRHLIYEAYRYLMPDGFFMLECMAGQGEEIRTLFEQDGHYHSITIHNDLAGLDRFVHAFART